MAGWFTRRTNAANNAHQGPVLFQMASKSKCMTGHTDPFSDGWGIHLTARVQASFQIVVRSRAGFLDCLGESALCILALRISRIDMAAKVSAGSRLCIFNRACMTTFDDRLSL